MVLIWMIENDSWKVRKQRRWRKSVLKVATLKKKDIYDAKTYDMVHGTIVFEFWIL